MSTLNLPRLLLPRFTALHPETGRPVSFGKVRTFYANTTSPKAAFLDRAGQVEAPNPVELDASGAADIFLSGPYRIEVYDANDAFLYEADHLNTIQVELPEGNPGSLLIANNLSDLDDPAVAREALGLRRQDSVTDATPDRVMMTGAFGIGRTSAAPVPGDNLNSITVSGIYAIGSATANRPFTEGAVLHMQRSADRAVQIAARASGSASTDLRWRERSGAGWSDWLEILSTKHVQTSASDTTAGRLMAVGAFGLGTAELPGIQDQNDARRAGMSQTWEPINGPGGTGWSFLTLPRNLTRIAQLAFRSDVGEAERTNLLSVRQSRDATTGDWFPWRQVWHENNRRSDTQDDARFTQRGNNLSDLTSPGTARSNLGLGSIATKNAGTGSGEHRTNAEADARYGRLSAENIWTAFQSLVGSFWTRWRSDRTDVASTTTGGRFEIRHHGAGRLEVYTDRRDGTNTTQIWDFASTFNGGNNSHSDLSERGSRVLVEAGAGLVKSGNTVAINATAGAVGDRALLFYVNDQSTSFGQSRSGSTLRYASVDNYISTSPSGTWECRGATVAATGDRGRITEWLRIA